MQSITPITTSSWKAYSNPVLAIHFYRQVFHFLTLRAPYISHKLVYVCSHYQSVRGVIIWKTRITWRPVFSYKNVYQQTTSQIPPTRTMTVSLFIKALLLKCLPLYHCYCNVTFTVFWSRFLCYLLKCFFWLTLYYHLLGLSYSLRTAVYLNIMFKLPIISLSIFDVCCQN
jgi:hypothetical protein